MDPSSVLSLTALGHRVAVDLTGVPAADRHVLAGPWSRCLDTTGAPADERWTVAVGEPATPVDLAAPTAAALAERLTMKVTLAAIGARRRELLMLHAGAVADPGTGAVVAYVGASGAGKTTASTVLGRELAYLSDETTAIRDDLTVVPYPKPLSVIRPGAHHRKEQAGPDELGLLPPPDLPLRLVGLLLLDRDAAHPVGAPPRVEPVGLAEAAPQLLAQVSYLADGHRPLHRVQALADACGGLLRVTYGEAAALAPVVRGLLSADEVTGRLARRRSLTAAAPPAPVPPAAGPPGTWTRTPAVDALAAEGSVVVLQDDRVTVLDGIAPVLYDALASPRTEEALVAAAVAAFGSPEGADPTLLVRAALDELAERGVVHRAGPVAG